MLLFRINPPPGVSYKSFAYKKPCNVVLQSSKHEEIRHKGGGVDHKGGEGGCP